MIELPTYTKYMHYTSCTLFMLLGQLYPAHHKH